MKNLLKLVFLAGFAFSAFRAFCNPLLAFSSSFSSEDKYQIKWEGSTEAQLYGSYVIMNIHNPNAPTRVEKVNAKLPYTVNFSTPKNAMVSASGDTLSKGYVIVEIYKNGMKCGKEAIIGSGAIGNKVCQ